MWVYIIIFIVAAIIGFFFGKNAHLKQLTGVLYSTHIVPAEQVDKVIDLVANYNKLRRAASKKAQESFQELLVAESLEKMKQEVKKDG